MASPTTSAVREALWRARVPLRTEWRRRRPPRSICIGDITLELDPRWASPEVREAVLAESYEEAERRVLDRTLANSDRYLELGVGLGVVLGHAARRLPRGAALGYEANPELVRIATGVLQTNAIEARVTHAVLGHGSATVEFFVHPEFWRSSLLPVAGAEPIQVPRLSLADAISSHQATYLMLDIEGGEVELLSAPLPASVRAVCLETHPEVVGDRANSDLVGGLLDQGFTLRIGVCEQRVLYFERDTSG